MSTTTIRLEEELRDRLAVAADRAGKTSHAFILEAIAQTVEQSELDAEFDQLADERWARLKDTGKSVEWSEARTFLEAKARGAKVSRPAARKPSR